MNRSYASLFALCALSAILLCVTSYQDPCYPYTTCESCLSDHSDTRCGWCSDTNTCLSVSDFRPVFGKCQNVSTTCQGISSPITRHCYNKDPMDLQRLRSLLHAGGRYALLGSNLTFNYQERKCAPLTGCTPWQPSSKYIPAIENVLLIVDDQSNLQVFTSTAHCDNINANGEPIDCHVSSLIPYSAQWNYDYGKAFGLVAPVQLGHFWADNPGQQWIPAPYSECLNATSNACKIYAWINKLDWKAQLTQDCFHLFSSFDDTVETFAEALVLF